jgi:DNA-binding NarL/FixJ family response regulator
MKNVLVIDDEAGVAEIVVEAIEHGIPGLKCEAVTDFAAASDRIAELRPDAIVLDLMEGNRSSNLPGERTWRSVWKDTFCPVVIYTGWEGDLTPPVPPNHPYVKVVIKGAGSEAQVVTHLKGFAPAVSAIKTLREEVELAIRQVLRDTAGAGVISGEDESQLLHAGRRRLAALMDAPTAATQNALKSWEQYLLPPIGESPLTGDVLCRRGADRSSCIEYRLVLTPSCDLVKGRKPSSVLVAKCGPVALLVKAMSLSLSPTKRQDSESRLVKEALTQGVWNGWVPLPEFPGHIPLLAANLKDLEVIPFAQVCSEDPADAVFDRVASIDSPFREQVAWAFLTTVARPGMPDRDLPTWATGCMRSATADVTAQGVSEAGQA